MNDEERLRKLSCPKGPVDMVLDTDAYNEVDDQYAISYAVNATEKLRVKAFYAAPFFNKKSSGPADGMEKSRREIQHILALAGREEYPVFGGSRMYLPDEKTPVDSEAMRDLCERAMRYSPEQPLYVVAIGAITNIASALLAAPEIAERIVIVWLGGNALHWPDNVEFNCRQDVAAARVVMDSGAPLVLLPCKGVVSAFTTTGPELEYWLRGRNALCDYLVDHTEETANAYAKGRVWSRPLWDVTVIGWLLNEEDRFMLSRIVPTPIPEYSHHYSRDLRRPPCRMVYHIYRDALLEDLIRHISKT